MMNQELENFFLRNKCKKGVGVVKEYCSIVLTDVETIAGDGVLLLDQVIDTDPETNKKEKFQKYLLPNKKILKFEEYMEKYGIKDYSNFDFIVGHNVEKDEPVKVNMFERMHSAVLGGTNSGKSIELKFLLSQFLQNPHTEFYIIDKGDFDMLKPTAKVAFKSKTDAMKGAEFFNFIQYFWLMANDRMRFFASLGCNEWREYKKNYMGTSPEYPNMNYIIVIIDEYQTLRSSLIDVVGADTFDRKMKQILDYVRSAGILFYFGSQNLQKEMLGNIRDAWASMVLGKLQYVMPGAVDQNVAKNLGYRMNGTYMFYDVGTNSYLKIPFTPDINKILINISNDPKNRLGEIHKYEKSYEMLNSQLARVDSDIFADVEGLMNFFQIPKSLFEKLKKTNNYPAFVVLCFVLARGIMNKLITRSFNLFEKISFSKPVDNELFDYILFFEGNKEFLKVLKESFDLSSNTEDFLETLNSILVNYLKTIVSDTKLVFNSSGEENVEESEELNEFPIKKNGVDQN